MPTIELDQAVWLEIKRADGSTRGQALVATPATSAEAGRMLNFSFGEFRALSVGVGPRGYTRVTVEQGTACPSIDDITGAPEFKGRIDMMCA